MSIAPEPYHSALMGVMQEAMVHVRNDARNGQVTSDQVADLMDSIHNIPHLVEHWEDCDEHYLKNSFVAYDMRWGSKGFKLLDLYMARLSANASKEH